MIFSWAIAARLAMTLRILLDTFASPELWTGFADFYERASRIEDRLRCQSRQEHRGVQVFRRRAGGGL